MRSGRRAAVAPTLAVALAMALAMAGAALAALALALGSARAQSLVADLSSHLIAITTGFTGTEVVLFGTTGGEGDVAVVVTGPRARMTVRRKERIAGVWLNTDRVVFEQAPSFHVVATSRPLERIVGAPLLERHQIGVDHLRLEPAEEPPGEALAAFRAALIRDRQRAGLYGLSNGQVTFLGERLFRTNIYFPANVPTGLYTVEVFLLRDGEVASAQTTPLVVSKVGLGAELYDFARARPAAYGVVAVIGAVAAGWLAGVAFRKV